LSELSRRIPAQSRPRKTRLRDNGVNAVHCMHASLAAAPFAGTPTNCANRGKQQQFRASRNPPALPSGIAAAVAAPTAAAAGNATENGEIP